jgi:hypothetical protein
MDQISAVEITNPLQRTPNSEASVGQGALVEGMVVQFNGIGFLATWQFPQKFSTKGTV